MTTEELKENIKDSITFWTGVSTYRLANDEMRKIAKAKIEHLKSCLDVIDEGKECPEISE